MTPKERLKMEFGNLLMGDSIGADNLAIALATYFDEHPDRPENDNETETGWGEWVETRTNEVLEKLADLASRIEAKP